MSHTTLTTPRTRRCSRAVIAAAAAALVLAPGAAFAAGQPAGPGGGHPAGTGTSHAGGKGGSHTGSHKTGRPGHTAGHTGAGHSTGHSTSHRAGTAGAAHSTAHPTRHAGNGHGATAGTAAAHSTSSSPASGSSGSSKSPQSPTAKNSAADQTATVTKLSVSKAGADGTVTMVARVSPAHRTAGAAEVTGSVVFSLDGASSGPVPMSGGRAMVQAEVGPGEHTASAKYVGDPEHGPSDSGPVGVTAG